MQNRHLLPFTFLLILLISSCSGETSSTLQSSDDPLPSWQDGPTKAAIMDYIEDVTDPVSNNFIPIEDRIATFDNDGNLWSEQPVYFQLYFALDRVKTMVDDHPEWKRQELFKAALADDLQGIMAEGHKGILELVMASHAGMSTDEFDAIVREWIKTAKHPTKNVRYDQLVYQPMLELLEFLRAHQFKTYIVSGGGIDFMRAVFTEIYGIPEEQIIGSRIKTQFEYDQNGNPVIKRLAALDYIDDKEGKPLAIQKIIGKKPVFASGNSDGDLPMLQWTSSNTHKSFMLYLHHTDTEREWAYDRDSPIGRLDQGLDEATAKGWTIIDMKSDWKVVYPFELN
jgi:phosphoserine phosphatase